MAQKYKQIGRKEEIKDYSDAFLTYLEVGKNLGLKLNDHNRYPDGDFKVRINMRKSPGKKEFYSVVSFELIDRKPPVPVILKPVTVEQQLASLDEVVTEVPRKNKKLRKKDRKLLEQQVSTTV